MSREKTDMIYDTLVDFRAETKDRLKRIEHDLREHKEGVIQNRAHIKALEKEQESILKNRDRIELLERPRLALEQIKKWSVWIVAVGGAIGILCKYMEWL